jgi:hypothetical protein
MARTPRKIFCLIQGAPIYDHEVQTLVLGIFGLQTEEIMPFLGETRDKVKKIKTALFTRLNVTNVLQLNRKAEMYGFDIFGNYLGVPVFTKRELKLLVKMYPWLELKPQPPSKLLDPPGPAL